MSVKMIVKSAVIERVSRRTLLSLAVCALMPMLAQANEPAASEPPKEVELLSPEQIEQRLAAARADANFQMVNHQVADKVAALDNVQPKDNQADDLPTNDSLATTEPSETALMIHGVPIAQIGDDAAPIGLDVLQLQQKATDETDGDINPDRYIPKYQDAQNNDAPIVNEKDMLKSQGIIGKLYDRLFNDGVAKVPRLKVQLYQYGDDGKTHKIDRKTKHSEPFANIQAALEDVTQESVLDFKAALPRLRQTVQAAARAVGFYEVKFSINKKAAGEIDLIIEDVGNPVRIETQVLEVRGEGADNEVYQAVLNTPTLAQGAIFNHGEYEATKDAIDATSGEQGFFDARWLDNSVDVILPDNVADVSLIYESGDRYAFDEVVFFTIDPETGELTDDPDKLPVKPKILQQLLTFKMGDAYNRQAVRALNADLLATGYFNVANIKTIYPERDVSDAVNFEQNRAQTDENAPTSERVELDDGVVAQVAPIEFHASQAIQDKIAAVAEKADALYNAPDNRVLPSDIDDKDKSILARISDAVAGVARAILPDEGKDEPILNDTIRAQLANRKSPQQVYQDKKVPLYVFVASDKPRDAHIGLGWGSDTGARLVTKFEHNLINRSGYQAGIETRLSSDKKGAKLYAERPWSHPLNDKVQASLSYEEEAISQSSGFDLSARTLEQGISRNIINKDGGWNKSYTLRYRLDELETSAPPETWEDLPVNFVDGKPTQEVLLAGVAFHKTDADNLVNPLRGFRQSYALEVGAKGVVSDTNMAIARVNLGGAYSFGDNVYGKDRAHQLLGQLQAGYIWAQDFDAVPYKLRFFAGGDNSVRGYNYNSLSPRSPQGYLTGGQALAVGSVEYNYEVYKDLRLAVFSDIGGAYDKDFSTDTKIGVGIGLRYASPVGQLRVDLAKGVDDDDTPIKLHFFIGSPF